MAHRPLIPLTLAYVCGILVAAWVPALLWLFLAGLLACLALLAVTGGRRWIVATVGVFVLLAGGVLTLLRNAPAPNDVSRLGTGPAQLAGVIGSDVDVLPGDATHSRAHFLLNAQQALTGPNAVPRRVSGQIVVEMPLQPEASPGRKAGSEIAPLVPHYGDGIRLRGLLRLPDGPHNPGGFDYAAWLRVQGIYAQLTVRRPDDACPLPDGEMGSLPLRMALVVRRHVFAWADRNFPPTEAALLKGILLGERADLPPDLGDAFKRTETVHILATAGLHVGIVCGLLLWSLRRAGLNRKIGALLTLLALALFALAAGGRPSVVRAVLMADIALCGVLLDREPDVFNTLALTALVILLANPVMLFDFGFQLSFAVVLTLVLWMPLLQSFSRLRAIPKSEPRIRRWTRQAVQIISGCFWVAVVAQLGALPLIAYYYNTVSLTAIPANTLAVPPVTLLIGAGFLSVLLHSVAPPLALPLDGLLHGLLHWVTGVVQAFAAPMWASVSVTSPPVPLIALYYAALWGVALWVRDRRRRRQEEALLHPGQRSAE